MTVTSKFFREATERQFDALLARYGFKRTKSEDEKFSFSVSYRADQRYVNIGATLHPHDYPYYLWLKFGEGSDEFPESDWNAIPLWLIVQHQSAATYTEEKDLYDISMSLTEADAEAKLRRVRESCEAFGLPFLEGNLALFGQLRATQNGQREPYRIYTPKKGGGYAMSYEEGSAHLKERFSNSAPKPWWKLW
ncbi:MAG TPA: hypothetical protein VGM64_00375 [Lacunisphaera sp.]|jgi:hypothetical protein